MDKLKATYKRISKNEVIVDGTGVYSYDKDPIEYMKARKYSS